MRRTPSEMKTQRGKVLEEKGKEVTQRKQQEKIGGKKQQKSKIME